MESNTSARVAAVERRCGRAHVGSVVLTAPRTTLGTWAYQDATTVPECETSARGATTGKRPGLFAALIVGVVIGLGAGGAVVWATIPDSTTGTITACYRTSGTNKGVLRVVDAQAGERCGSGEARLTWQQRSFCNGYPHAGVDWSIPGSSPGHGCNLAGAFLYGQNLSNANLTNANVTHATLEPPQNQATYLSGANLTQADLRYVFFTAANLTGANLSKADAEVAWFNNANLTNANMTDANLGNAYLSGATLTNVTWANTTCPDGTNSNNDGNTCVGHL